MSVSKAAFNSSVEFFGPQLFLLHAHLPSLSYPLAKSDLKTALNCTLELVALSASPIIHAISQSPTLLELIKPRHLAIVSKIQNW